MEPTLAKILEGLKSQAEIYKYFMLASDNIALDLQAKDIDTVKYSELKNVYQTIFGQIRDCFKEENEKDALEALRKLGLKVITQWRDIVKLGLSEDVLRILESP
jgi:hypothetical protein